MTSIKIRKAALEARLADLGAAWATSAKPQHDIEGAAESGT